VNPFTRGQRRTLCVASAIALDPGG